MDPHHRFLGLSPGRSLRWIGKMRLELANCIVGRSRSQFAGSTQILFVALRLRPAAKEILHFATPAHIRDALKQFVIGRLLDLVRRGDRCLAQVANSGSWPCAWYLEGLTLGEECRPHGSGECGRSTSFQERTASDKRRGWLHIKISPARCR